MQSIYGCLLGSALLMGGCAMVALPMPSSNAPFAVVVDVTQMMNWIIDPTVDVIWESVRFIDTEEGSKQISPKTDEEWDAVRNAAATLAESSNLLMIEGRAREGKQWMEAATNMRTAAKEALSAAQSKNVMGVFDAGGHIYNACSTCHMQFAKHLQN